MADRQPKALPGLLDSERFTTLEAQVADLQQRVAALEAADRPQPQPDCRQCEGRGERLWVDGMMHICGHCDGTGKEPV